MATDRPDPPIPLPKGWPDHIRSAVLHVMSLARLASFPARCSGDMYSKVPETDFPATVTMLPERMSDWVT